MTDCKHFGAKKKQVNIFVACSVNVISLLFFMLLSWNNLYYHRTVLTSANSATCSLPTPSCTSTQCFHFQNLIKMMFRHQGWCDNQNLAHSSCSSKQKHWCVCGSRFSSPSLRWSSSCGAVSPTAGQQLFQCDMSEVMEVGKCFHPTTVNVTLTSEGFKIGKNT